MPATVAPARTCAACAEPISPQEGPGRPRRYCSGSCRAWHHRHPEEARVRRACERCGTLLAVNARPERRWCSTRCKEARKRDPRRDELERYSRPPDDHAIDADLLPWLMAPEVGEPNVLVPPAPPWMARAACHGMPVEQFVSPGKGPLSEATRRVCAGCPVRDECLAYALADPDLDSYGIFGGLTARERRRLTRRAEDEAA